LIALLFTLFLVALNGFFVAAEFAIVKVRISQIEMHIKANRSGARLSKQILENLDGYLAATQLGITLASLGLGWIGEPVVSRLLIKMFHLFNLNISDDLAHNIALPIGFLIITILHIVFGELAPKSVAIQRSEATTLIVAKPLRIFYVIFKPFIWVLNNIASVALKLLGIKPVHGSEIHSSDELKYLVREGKEHGVIEEENYAIIKNAFDFSNRNVREVMVPRRQVIGIDVNNFNETTIEKIIDEGFSRIPCYENSLDNVVGVVYLKEVLLKYKKGEDIVIRELMRPVMAVPESKKIGSMLKDFQYRHQQLAIVTNEYGGTDGIITMEDILEELVGEIQDEYDNEKPVIEQINPKTFTAFGTTPIFELNRVLPTEIKNEKGEADSIAGYIIEYLGRLPAVNEKIRINGYEFTVLKKIKNTIMMVQIKIVS
jgi:CBS domain containing-hemolysin-like protein